MTRAALCILLIGVFLLPAQQEEAVFKSSSNLVILDVTARDSSGKEIPNLRKEDFVVLEDGKLQTLSVFEFQRLADTAAPAAPLPARRTPVPGRAQQIATTTPGSIQYQDRRLMIMFFDFSSMGIPEQLRAQKAALEFVDKRMGPSDLVSIMTFSSKLDVQEDFTDDKERLVAAIKGFHIGLASDLAVEGGDGSSGEDTAAAFSADETEFNIFNTDRKLSALESAAKMLAVLPEKKALLYFSSGVGKSGVENQSQLRSTVNAAVRANVSFYPIDARGLAALPPGGDASTAAPKGNAIFTGQAQQSQRDRFNDQQETLVSLAADTGGKAFLDNNDLALGIVQARDEVRSYYVLGYYSSNDRADGKFRRVQVKLASQPSAKLEYRGGYFASKVFAKFTAADRERQLEEALTLGDPITDMPVAAEANYFRLNRKTYFVPVSLKIPGSVIPLAKKGASEETDVDFIGQMRDAKGKLISTVRDEIKVKLSETRAGQLGTRSLQYDAGFTLAPGTYQLKFLVRENRTGKMGTFQAPLVVPDLSAASDVLRLSSVVWSSQRQSMQEAVGSAGARKKDLAANPLIRDGQKLVPSITRAFRKNQNLYVYLEVYDPAAAEPDSRPNVAAVLSFYRGKRKAFESSPVRLTQFAEGRPNVLPVSFQTPLAALPAGKYVCQVDLIDENARRFAFRRVEIALLP